MDTSHNCTAPHGFCISSDGCLLSLVELNTRAHANLGQLRRRASINGGADGLRYLDRGDNVLRIVILQALEHRGIRRARRNGGHADAELSKAQAVSKA